MTDAAATSAPRRAPLPPRAAGRPLLGLLREWRRGPLDVLDRLRADYGDVVRMPVGTDITVLAHPDGIRHVLQDNHTNYKKGFDYARLAPFVGEGLLTANGEVWRRHRRLAQPAFHRQRVSAWASLMVARAEALLDRWRALPPGATVDVHHEMSRLTLEVAGEALFSADMGPFVERMTADLGPAIRIADERVGQVVAWPPWVPTPFNRRMNRVIARLTEVVDALIGARRQQEHRDDLLGMLMAASDDGQGPALTDAELRDEVMTLIVAGHETTANALTFALVLLSQHPEERERLHRAVAARCGERPVEAADAGHLPYARQVAEEAMRLYPPVWTMAREAIDDDVIGGYRVEAGRLVLLAPWLPQRDPRFWPDPLRFDPGRFAEDAASERARLAYFPFGAGPRMCIGKSFAMVELELVLARLAQAVSVEVDAPAALPLEATITLRAKGPVPARLTWR